MLDSPLVKISHAIIKLLVHQRSCTCELQHLAFRGNNVESNFSFPFKIEGLGSIIVFCLGPIFSDEMCICKRLITATILETAHI